MPSQTNDLLILAYRDVKPAALMAFQESAAPLGLTCQVVEPHKIAVEIGPGPIVIDASNNEVLRPKLVVGLTTARFIPLLKSAYAIWRSEGTHVLNRGWQVELGRDKLAAALALEQAAIPQIPTVGHSPDQVVVPPWDSPSVAKPAYGFQGQEVELLEDGQPAVLTPPQYSPNSPFQGHRLLQPYVGETNSDLRAYVVDGTCVGLMRRTAQAGEWRTNAALGADCSRMDLEDPAAALAVRAIAAVGLEAGGVDILEASQGLRVLEVDGWAGFDELSKVCEVDVAASILMYMKGAHEC